MKGTHISRKASNRRRVDILQNLEYRQWVRWTIKRERERKMQVLGTYEGNR